MRRRTLLLGGAIAAAGALAAPAIAQNRRTLKMATAWPVDFPGFAGSAERLAKSITEATGGSLNITVQPADEFVPAAQLHDACGHGRIDLYHAIEYYWEAKSKAYNFFAGVPFGMTAQEMDIWLHGLGGQELWDELSGRDNVKPFAAGNTGMRMAGWFRNRLRGKGDVDGLKIRVSGMAATIWRRLGAKIITMPAAEVIPALKAKRLDAAEFVGPWLDMKQDFQDAAKYYYYPGFSVPGTQVSLGMNLDLWNFLSEQERAAVRTACRAETVRMLAEFNAQNAESLEKLRHKSPEALQPLPVEVLVACGKAASDVIAEAGRADALSARIYQSFMDARTGMLAEAKDGAETQLASRRELSPGTAAEEASAPEDRYEARETQAARRRRQSQQQQQGQQQAPAGNAGDQQQGEAARSRRPVRRQQPQEAADIPQPIGGN